jgi:hypothetical protein
MTHAHSRKARTSTAFALFAAWMLNSMSGKHRLLDKPEVSSKPRCAACALCKISGIDGIRVSAYFAQCCLLIMAVFGSVCCKCCLPASFLWIFLNKHDGSVEDRVLASEFSTHTTLHFSPTSTTALYFSPPRRQASTSLYTWFLLISRRCIDASLRWSK